MPDAVVQVRSVQARESRSGNTRYVLTDSDGNEYTTFREAIADDARRAEGRTARITFHEQERGAYRNVYLDGVEIVADQREVAPDHEVEEVAWKTAIDAAPWLLGSQPKQAVDDEELFEALQPFKERVADDIRDGDDESHERAPDPRR